MSVNVTIIIQILYVETTVMSTGTFAPKILARPGHAFLEFYQSCLPYPESENEDMMWPKVLVLLFQIRQRKFCFVYFRRFSCNTLILNFSKAFPEEIQFWAHSFPGEYFSSYQQQITFDSFHIVIPTKVGWLVLSQFAIHVMSNVWKLVTLILSKIPVSKHKVFMTK